MTAASARQQALDVADQLHVMGPVEVGRFFGGAGLALDGRQFGFVMKGKPVPEGGRPQPAGLREQG
jgi:DNA transformation protein